MKFMLLRKMPEIEKDGLNIMAVLGGHSKKGLQLRGRGAHFCSQSLRSWAKLA